MLGRYRPTLAFWPPAVRYSTSFFSFYFDSRGKYVARFYLERLNPLIRSPGSRTLAVLLFGAAAGRLSSVYRSNESTESEAEQ